MNMSERPLSSWSSPRVLNVRIVDFDRIVMRAVLTVMWYKSTGLRDTVSILHYYRILFEYKVYNIAKKARHLFCHYLFLPNSSGRTT